MSLVGERDTIAAILRDAGIGHVFTYIPENAAIPSAVISSGSPYLEPPDTYGRGRYRAHWRVMLLFSANRNEAATAKTDESLEDAIVALVSAGYAIETVEPIGATQLNGATYTGLPFYITKQIQI